MLDKVMATLTKLREFRQFFADNDDNVDRLHRHYTCCLLLASASMVGLKQFVGAPIDCWCPGHFSQSHVNYANSICWVNGTYYVPMEEYLPLPGQTRSVILYYQWVPFFLVSQAFVFTLPGLLWRELSKTFGINLSSLIESVGTSHLEVAEFTEITGQNRLRRAIIQVVAYLRGKNRHLRAWRNDYLLNDGLKHYDVILKHRKKSSNNRWFCFTFALPILCGFCDCKSTTSNKIYFLYLIVKLLNMANVCFQFLFLTSFLNNSPHGGFISTFTTSLERLSLDELVNFQLDPGRFPKVTMCDFHIRQQINLHRYSVQCVLPINLFNEKVFLMIWVWFVFLFVVTVFNILAWMPLMFLSCQVTFMKKQLKYIQDDSDRIDSHFVKRFLTSYLGRDGLLIYKLVTLNTYGEGSALMLKGLWREYRRCYPQTCMSRKGFGTLDERKIKEGSQTSSFWRGHRARATSKRPDVPPITPDEV